MQQGKMRCARAGTRISDDVETRASSPMSDMCLRSQMGAVGVGSTPDVLCASYKFPHLQPGEEMYALAFAGELFLFYTL